MPAQLKKIGGIAFLLAAAALAQTNDELKSKIATLRYPPLPQQARIEGDVHLKVTSGTVILISGHPLLAPAAIENAKTLGPNLGVTYHFVIDQNAKMVDTWTTVKRGNAFERAFLRAFGFKTEKTVVSGCESIPPPNEVKADGAAVEIWIYGKTYCAQPATATLVARR